jgi:hypothetical protein
MEPCCCINACPLACSLPLLETKRRPLALSAPSVCERPVASWLPCFLSAQPAISQQKHSHLHDQRAWRGEWRSRSHGRGMRHAMPKQPRCVVSSTRLWPCLPHLQAYRPPHRPRSPTPQDPQVAAGVARGAKSLRREGQGFRQGTPHAQGRERERAKGIGRGGPVKVRGS